MTTQITTDNIQTSSIYSLQGPRITTIQITNSSYVVLDDTAVSTSGGYIKITGTGFTSGSQVLVNSIAATSTTYVSSTELRAQLPATAAGTYILYVSDTNGGLASKVNGITFSGTPTWVTGSTLTSGTATVAYSTQLSATSDSAITYALQAGSTLPTGLSLSSSGLLSGTVTVGSDTTYSFTITATDVELQDSPRTFSLTMVALTVPGAPTIGSATTTGSTTATVSFTAPVNNGGTVITQYIATSSPGNITGTLNQAGSGTITVSGLTTGTAYTFTVKAVNSVGQSTASSASNSITTYSVPGAPTIGSASIVETTATVTFTAPASNGGSTITSYTAVSSPGSITGTISQSGSGSITVSGLTVGTSYTFTVYATNAIGNGASSAASNSVTAYSPTGYGSIYFDGSSYLTTPTGQNYVGGSGDFTIEFWHMPTGLTGQGGDGAQGIIGGGTSSNGNSSSIAIRLATGTTQATKRWQFWISGYDNAATGTSTVSYNVWNHVALVRSGSSCKLYINGTLECQQTNGYSVPTSYSIYPGRTYNDYNGEYCNGYISNLRILSGTALYTSNFTPPTAPLTAITNTTLLTCQRNGFVDNNTQLPPKTVSVGGGNPTVETFNPFGS